MNTKLLNAHLLKIPPLQIVPNTHQATGRMNTFRKNADKIRTHVVQSFSRFSFFTPFVETFLNPFIGRFNLSRNQKLCSSANYQLNVYRNYSQKSSSKTRRAEKKDRKKRDTMCGEDCISIKKENVKKKRQGAMKTDGVSFNVNLNAMINELVKKKDAQKLHGINKISNFIFKPVDCKVCGESTKKKSIGKLSKANQQKRSNSSFVAPESIHPKYEMKRKEFQKETYEEMVNYNPKSNVSSIPASECQEQFNKKPLQLTRSENWVPDVRSKGPVPLFMLIKCNSGKTKAIIDHYSNNVKYKVGTNEAFFKNNETFFLNKTPKKTGNVYLKRSRSEGDVSENRRMESFPHVTGETKLEENLAEFTKPLLAETVYEMLKPVIEKEFLQYKEVKTAIQRLENSLEIYINQSNPNINSTINKTRFDLPKSKIEIREPKTYAEISEPSHENHCKSDPATSSAISAPSLNKAEIVDPTDYEIVILADNCNKDGSGKSQANAKSNDKLTAKLCQDDKKHKAPCGEQSCHKKDKDPCEKKSSEQDLKCKSKSTTACSSDCFKAKKDVNDSTKTTICEPKVPKKSCESSKETSCKKTKKTGDFCRKSDEESSEEIFRKAKNINSMPFCDESCISQEPKMPLVKTKNNCSKPSAPEQACPPKCTQRSCTQKSLEPTQPPNCCKPLTRKGFYEKPCPSTPRIPKELTGVKQSCCEELVRKQQREAAVKNSAADPTPPGIKQLEPQIKCDPPSKTETRYCTKPVKKLEEAIPKTAGCTKLRMPRPPQKIEPKPPREPKQALKDLWFPVKIRTKKTKPSCECKPPSQANSEATPAVSRSPKLSTRLPKPGSSRNDTPGDSKGIFSSLRQIFCPSKNKPGTKGVSSCPTNSCGGFGGFSNSAPAGSSGSSPRRKSGTMTFAIYSKRNRKYPWNVTRHQERFICKKPKTSDPCGSKKSDEKAGAEADSNKLQCICYEEIRKRAEKGQHGGEDCKKKNEKQLTFKPTKHSKICQMEDKRKSKSSKCGSKSQKAEQGKNKSCVEKDASNTSTSKKAPTNVCAQKLKTSTKTESKSSCPEKPKTFKERCKPNLHTKQPACPKKREQSKTKPASKNPIRNKYPWKKCPEKKDAKLCVNESNITKKSMEQEKADKKNVKKDCKGSIEKMLQEKPSSSCFRADQKKKDTKPKSGSEDGTKSACKKVKSDTCTEKSKDKKQACDTKKNENKLESKSDDICQKKTTEDPCKRSKDDKTKKCADKKESICERIKKAIKDGKDGKECFMPKKSKDPCEKTEKRAKSEEEKCPVTPKKCEKATATDAGEKIQKMKDDKANSTSGKASPKKCDSLAETNTEKLHRTKDVTQVDDKDSMFICKVKPLGKGEQLVCSSSNENSQAMNFKERGVLRLLKCKKTKDEFGRDVFVCKEIKSSEDKNAVLQEELQQMKNLLKQHSLPNIPKERAIVSKKIVCQEVADGTKVCSMEDVTEIVEGSRRSPVRSAPKKSPVSYQDLLKRSEEVRRAENDKTRKREVANVPEEDAGKKTKDC